MFKAYTKSSAEPVVPIILVQQDNFLNFASLQSISLQNWISASGFKPDANKFLLVPDEQGKLVKVIFVINASVNLFSYSILSAQLPYGVYQIMYDTLPSLQKDQAVLGWGLGIYRYARYKKEEVSFPKLMIAEEINLSAIQDMVLAIYLIRDLINTPADDMMPADLEKITQDLAHNFAASMVVTSGSDLLVKNYPAIYTVGRASSHAPQLIDLTWGEEKHPKLTLVGKGVCFDTGGLNIKSAKGMELMKKDMAGAAHVLGLASLIMSAKLKVRLRVLIPAVENAIDGGAYHPGDVIKMRKGTTVEIGNTDAEGRLVLADALTEAATEKPDLIIDIASLTGAAKVALGAEIPAYFTNCDTLAQQLDETGQRVQDMMWRLPLYQPYRQYLQSRIADLNNAACVDVGGAITAALFLESFVEADVSWIHIDLMGWNISDLPGRKIGAEAMGIRTLFQLIKERY